MAERYYLTETDIKKVQKIELELLIEFDRVCKKNNIIYSIDGGTLLGAVRHKGFIPWDDDADVIMNRCEYDKLMEVIDSELDNTRFYYQDMNRTQGYRWGYGKLRRKGTEFVRLNQEFMPYQQGVFLDVFVCDYVPNNYFLRAICNFVSFMYRKIFYSEVAIRSETGIKKLGYLLLNKIPESRIKKSYNKYRLRRNKKKSNWVKCLTFPACNRTFGYKKEWYLDVQPIIFEGVSLLGCKKWDEYLTFMYGNYLELPPKEKRKAHPVSKLKFSFDEER